MEKEFHRITDSELTIVQCLWDAPTALTMNEILSQVHARCEWEDSTIKTMVQRLCTKGVVAKENRGVFYYAPRISREVYSEQATRNLVRQLYRGSAKRLVAALVDSELSEEDIDELRAILEEGRGK